MLLARSSISLEIGFSYALTISLAIDTDDVAAQIAQHLAANEHVRGVRHMLNWHDTDVSGRALPREHYYLEAPFDRGLCAVEAAGLHFEVHLYHTQLAAFAAVPPRHPHLPFVLNHAGICLAPRDPAAVAAWRAGMAAMASSPNVYCKISGLAMVEHEPTLERLRPLIDTVIALFGVDRCMFGSNFPVDKKFVTYDQLYAIYDAATRHLSAADRRKLFRGNAERFYKI